MLNNQMVKDIKGMIFRNDSRSPWTASKNLGHLDIKSMSRTTVTGEFGYGCSLK